MYDFGMPEEGVIKAEELWDAIKSRKLNINATKDVRERQREKMDAKRAAVLQIG